MARPEAPRAETTLNGKGLITELGLDRPQGVTLKGLSPHTRSLDTIDLAIQVAKAVRPEPNITIVTIPAPVEKDATSTTEALQRPGLADVIDFNTHRAQRGLGRLRNAGRRIAASTSAAAFGIAALGTPAMATETQQPQGIVIEGNMPSYSPTLVFEGQTVRAETQAAYYPTEILKMTNEDAAIRLGSEMDPYTQLAANWRELPNGGVELIPDGRMHRLRIRFDAANNRPVIGDATIPANGERNGQHVTRIRAIISSKVDEVEVIEGKFYRIKNPKKNLSHQYFQLYLHAKAEEARSGSQINVEPLCKPTIIKHKTNIPMYQMTVAFAIEHLAQQGDAYELDPSHWFINEFGGATLIADPSGETHLLNTGYGDSQGHMRRFTIEGYLDTPERAVAGNRALGFVAIAQGPQSMKKIELRGGTVWLTKFKADDYAEFWKIWADKVKAEAADQPGVLVVPFSN